MLNLRNIRSMKNKETGKSPIAEPFLQCNHNVNTIKLLKQNINKQELNIREVGDRNVEK